MMAPNRWEVLEKIGAYAASELPPDEARQVERMILDDPQALGLAEPYLRMLALLGAVGEEEAPQAPRAVIDYAIRRAAVSAFSGRRRSSSRGSGAPTSTLSSTTWASGTRAPPGGGSDRCGGLRGIQT